MNPWRSKGAGGRSSSSAGSRAGSPFRGTEARYPGRCRCFRRAMKAAK